MDESLATRRRSDLGQDPFFRVITSRNVSERLARAGFPDGRSVPLALRRKIVALQPEQERSHQRDNQQEPQGFAKPV